MDKEPFKGLLYLASAYQEASTGYFKVGITRSNYKLRFNSIQTNNPFQILTNRVVSCSNPEQLEAKVIA